MSPSLLVKPTSRPGTARWALSSAFLFVGALVATASCFNPTILDGTFRCGDGGRCPSGFACAVDGLCRKGAAAAAPDGGAVLDASLDSPDATTVDAPTVGGDAQDGPPAEKVCVSPVAGCVPQSGVCDPVCQTGCGCEEKCSVNTNGTIACLGLEAGLTMTGKPCQISGYLSPTQNDTCVPGDVCLLPGGPGAATPYCFALCRTEADCTGGVPCVERPVGRMVLGQFPVAKVCDVPFVPCDPFAPMGSNNCPTERPICYVSTPDPLSGEARTVCEYKAGGKGRTTPCDASRDCFANLTCPGMGAMDAGTCHVTCDANHGCSAGVCIFYNKTYGYCSI